MSRVAYAPVAENDLVGLVDCIARDNPAAARRWVQKIRQTCETLATQAEMGEQRLGFGVPGCRSFSVGGYVVFFDRSTTEFRWQESSPEVAICELFSRQPSRVDTHGENTRCIGGSWVRHKCEIPLCVRIVLPLGLK